MRCSKKEKGRKPDSDTGVAYYANNKRWKINVNKKDDNTKQK